MFRCEVLKLHLCCLVAFQWVGVVPWLLNCPTLFQLDVVHLFYTYMACSGPLFAWKYLILETITFRETVCPPFRRPSSTWPAPRKKRNNLPCPLPSCPIYLRSANFSSFVLVYKLFLVLSFTKPINLFYLSLVLSLSRKIKLLLHFSQRT